MKKLVKLFDPFIGKDEERALSQTLKSHFWASGAGTGQVAKFEAEFNRFIGADKCIAVSNGTAALHLALSLVDIRGKEVILPSLSFVSTAHAVLYNGGKPVFADVDPNTLCIDPDAIEKLLTKKTRVILPVHFAGMPCNMDKISEICKQNNIVLMEDAAHASGATYNSKRIGTHGTAICFSFHPTKNLAMPTGGAITLNGKNASKFARILKSTRWCGIANRNGPKYDITNLGWNYYMNEFSAAIGRVQLKKLETMNKKRKSIAKRYAEEIRVKEKIGFSSDCSYHLYWILVKNREKFMDQMRRNGVETGIHYLPIHKMYFYSGNHKLPITEKVTKEIVSIPIHPSLDESDVDKVIKTVNQLST